MRLPQERFLKRMLCGGMGETLAQGVGEGRREGGRWQEKGGKDGGGGERVVQQERLNVTKHQPANDPYSI